MRNDPPCTDWEYAIEEIDELGYEKGLSAAELLQAFKLGVEIIELARVMQVERDLNE